MAGNSTKQINHILDLPDEDLTKIFSYVDHYSLLDAMLVCRRFESWIGQNAQLYKNHKLAIKRKLTAVRESESSSSSTSEGPAPKKAKLMYFGRYFGDVSLDDYVFSPGSKFFPPLLDTFEIIGSKINKLEIKNSQAYKNPILEVLQLANDVKELIIEKLKINENAKSMKYKEIDVKKCTFPELRSLELSSVTNFAIIEDAFYAVNSLHHFKLGKFSYGEWDIYQQLLFKQIDLRSLDLIQVVVGSFELKSWNIEKLVLNRVKFPNREVFQTFVSFIKSLSNVSELEFDSCVDEMLYHNNYKEILEHLLNLPSLTKLKLAIPVKALNIHNPSVKTFGVTLIESYSDILRYFPNIETLELTHSGIDMTSMPSLIHLRELKFNFLSEYMLEKINCPQIQKISIDCDMQIRDPKVWRNFVQRHPNVEYVELKGGNVSWRKYSKPIFVAYFKFFPKLKTLKLYNQINTYSLAELVENLTGLEHLEIVVDESDVKEAAEYLRLKFPQLGCDSRKFQKSQFGGWDWLITLRKI
jgi:hypothetical protein